MKYEKILIYVMFLTYNAFFFYELIRDNAHLWMIIAEGIIIFLAISTPLILKLCRFLKKINGDE